MERRKRRSTKHHEAVSLYLDALRQKEHLDAVTLSTAEGLLIGGSGSVDLDWMAALGPASKRAFFSWQQHMLHVRQIELDGFPLFITSAGKRVPSTACVAGLSRILAGV